MQTIKNHIARNIIVLSIFGFLLVNSSLSSQNPINKNITKTFIVEEKISAEVDRERMVIGSKLCDFDPSYIFIPPGEEVKITAKLLEGDSLPKVVFGTFSKFGRIDPTVHQLTSDKPYVLKNDTLSDLNIAIRYTSSNPNSKAEITIEGGLKNPYLTLEEYDIEGFKKMMNTYTYSEVILMSKYCYVVASKENVMKVIDQDWKKWFNFLDGMIDAQAYFSGLDNSSPTHAREKHKYHFTESPRGFMYAKYYRTSYNKNGPIMRLLDYSILNGIYGSGIYHEVGHQHQISPITWDKVLEVNVNLYTIITKRELLGFDIFALSDEQKQRIKDYVTKPFEEKDFNSGKDKLLRKGNKLNMYLQLWKHYGEDFLINVNKSVREDGKYLKGREAKCKYFVKKVSTVAGEDLTSFFKDWGFQVGEETYKEIADMKLPKPKKRISRIFIEDILE